MLVTVATDLLAVNTGSWAAPLERRGQGGRERAEGELPGQARSFGQPPPWDVSSFVLKTFQRAEQSREMRNRHSPTRFLHTTVVNILSYLFLSLF